MTYDVRNSGIPALAYPHDALSSVSLSLFIKCNDRRAQMTLCLQTSLALQGFEGEQTVILQYDADQVVPGTISLGPATIPLPQQRLDALARAGNPQMRTLSLKLRNACPVWCLPTSVPLTPRPGCGSSFYPVAALAQSTYVDILFDYNWLHRSLQTSLQRLIKHPEELSGFPVSQRYREQRLQQANWRVFSTEAIQDDLGVATTVEGEFPPDYAEASSKRHRQASTSHATSSPPPKRILLSPYEEPFHESPTEKGSTATPSPKHPLSETTRHKFSPLVTLSSQPHTPSARASTGSPPPTRGASPAASGLNVQRAVDQAVAALLPDIVGTLLPSLLPRLLAASSPTPSSQHSLASQLSQSPPPPKLSALGITLHDRLAGKLESDIRYVYAHTLSHANWLRNTADDRFADMLEEERLALERVAEEKFEEFKARCEGIEEDVTERVGRKAEELGEAVTSRLEEERLILEREREEFKQAKNELRMERDELRKDREDLRLDKQDLRQQKEDLRRESEALCNERRCFEAKRRQVMFVRESATLTRAGSAPV